MDALETDAEITKTFLIQVIKNAFPGAKLRATERIGGIVLGITAWQFQLEVSVNTEVVAITDEVGFASLTLTQVPVAPHAAKAPAIITIIKMRTKSPDDVQRFLARSLAYIQGAAAAILSAVDKPEDTEDDIFGGFED